MKKSTLIFIALFAVFTALGWLFDNIAARVLLLVAAVIFATVALITVIKEKKEQQNDQD